MPRAAMLVRGISSGLLSVLTACSGGAGGAAGGGGDSAAAAMPAPPDPAAVRQAIEAANAKGVEAWRNNNDFAPMLTNYEDGALIMQPGMPIIRGRAAWGEAVAGMMKTLDFKDMVFRTDDVTVSGDYAVEVGSYSWKLGPKGGKLAADSGKYLTVWRKQGDGSWKIIRDINNSDIAPAQ
jgi:ketosteroid isomerase-like protein